MTPYKWIRLRFFAIHLETTRTYWVRISELSDLNLLTEKSCILGREIMIKGLSKLTHEPWRSTRFALLSTHFSLSFKYSWISYEWPNNSPFWLYVLSWLTYEKVSEFDGWLELTRLGNGQSWYVLWILLIGSLTFRTETIRNPNIHTNFFQQKTLKWDWLFHTVSCQAATPR